MIEVRYLRKMINGVPVMTTPAEIDVTTVEQLRAVVLAATERYRTLVVDMTRTRFCDSAAVHALIAARKRVLAEGGELRLVVPADGTVQRVLTLLGVDRFIPCFASLEEAVAAAFDGAPAIRSECIKRGPASGQVVMLPGVSTADLQPPKP